MNSKYVFFFSALFLLFLPRLIRCLYPEVYIEDDFYLQNALLMLKGYAPYLDFVTPNFPLLEMFFKNICSIFGATVRTVEITTQIVVFVNSCLILLMGMKLSGSRASGLLAAILYACSAQIFKYHLLEREIYTNCFVIMGCSYYLLFNKEKPFKYFILGIIFGLSALIKLTGVLPVVLICFFLMIQKRFYLLTIFIFTLGGVLTIATLLCYCAYGYPFYFQVFLFHFLKGSRLFLGRINVFIKGADLSIFCGILGFLFYKAGVNKAAWDKIKGLFVLYPAFFIFISSTVWIHNLIDMLPFACLLGGAFLWALAQTVFLCLKTKSLRAFQTCPAIIAIVLAVVLFFFIKPWQTDEGNTKTLYGFGTIPRAEINSLAMFIKANTSKDDMIFCPIPLIAFNSNRKTVVTYWEYAGVEVWARQSVRQHGFLETKKKAASINFMENIFATRRYAYALFQKNIEGKNVPLLIKLKPQSPVPSGTPHNISRPLLDFYSGEKLKKEKHFEIFTFVKKKPIMPFP